MRFCVVAHAHVVSLRARRSSPSLSPPLSLSRAHTRTLAVHSTPPSSRLESVFVRIEPPRAHLRIHPAHALGERIGRVRHGARVVSSARLVASRVRRRRLTRRPHPRDEYIGKNTRQYDRTRRAPAMARRLHGKRFKVRARVDRATHSSRGTNSSRASHASSRRGTRRARDASVSIAPSTMKIQKPNDRLTTTTTTRVAPRRRRRDDYRARMASRDEVRSIDAT